MNAVVLIRRHRGKLVSAVLLMALAAWFVWNHRADLSRENLVARGREFHAAWFIAAFFILPVIGFPVNVLLLLAGVRFGLPGGMALAAGGTFFHHFAVYRICHGWLREKVQRRLEKAGRKIPSIKDEHRILLTSLFAAIHGPPYAAKLYLLALTDVPFRIYFWVSAPIYILFCLVPVGAGSAVTDFSPKWLYAMTALSMAILLVGFWLKKRFGNEIVKSD
ncbi:VTT domain-containing protein [Haloferula sp. BvORR071]|uniref:TVP38/TMEM64 family protein n=1 Tax=Haloferula sp. BvORR071 TaxID=1396141 RepID=UPI00055380D4|nr:VTT domain-containing protein [Haloferula sp. BvORR071]